MEEQSWLIEERTELNARTLMGLERSLSVTRGGPAKAAATGELAVRLTSLVILDNKKWFGEADVRLDALVSCVPATTQGELYHPQTFRFTRVGDGDALVSKPGLLLFYGRPRYFLDVSISVSRDRRDSGTLASLITKSAGSAAVGESLQVLAGVATMDPTAQIVVGAVTAAGKLADTAYAMLRAATHSTIGLYRASWLQHRDNFGIGTHPGDRGTFRVKDLTFAYEIVDERAANHRRRVRQGT